MPNPSQMNPVHALPLYFFTICINFVLPSTPRRSKWAPSFRFSHQNPAFSSVLSPSLLHGCYDHSNNMWWVLITNFLQTPVTVSVHCAPEHTVTHLTSSRDCQQLSWLTHMLLLKKFPTLKPIFFYFTSVSVLQPFICTCVRAAAPYLQVGCQVYNTVFLPVGYRRQHFCV